MSSMMLMAAVSVWCPCPCRIFASYSLSSICQPFWTPWLNMRGLLLLAATVVTDDTMTVCNRDKMNGGGGGGGEEVLSILCSMSTIYSVPYKGRARPKS